MKSITIISLSSKLPLASNGRETSYLYNNGWSFQWGGRMASLRRAHHVVRGGLPSVGRGPPPLPHSIQVSNISQEEGGRACHLSRVWAATSRVRHLSKGGALPNRHVQETLNSIFNQSSISLGLSPLTFSLTLCLYCVFNLVPTYLFIFALADFYWIKMTFLGFWE